MYRASVWNCYKIRHFLLHLGAQLNIDKGASPKGSTGFMIVCSCNVLSDHDVRNAVSAASDLPRNAKQVYGCLGCSAECGRCARTIKTIIDEALGACAKECCQGCPHSLHAVNDKPAQDVTQSFALAAC
jgi:bacterioferritin-associated ferredoxin